MSAGPNPHAWNNWYHAIGTTYGTWLRGDPRGFRTFRHRQHIEGDYKHPPPPGQYDSLFEQSQRDMRHPPTVLNPQQRGIVCEALAERLLREGVELVALAVASNHFHLLARFPPLDAETLQTHAASLLHDGRDPAPRHILGLAKKHASYALSDHNLKPQGPVWATRPKLEPIHDRQHQLNVARYIARHVQQDAAVWVIGKSTPPPA